MRVLFDQGTPVPLRSFLTNHTVKTAAELGWSALTNGELLRVAEASGFEVLLTTDKNLVYQQVLQGRRIAIIVIGNAQWPILRVHVHKVIVALNAAIPGTYSLVEIG